jgi:hypothetical protein
VLNKCIPQGHEEQSMRGTAAKPSRASQSFAAAISTARIKALAGVMQDISDSVRAGFKSADTTSLVVALHAAYAWRVAHDEPVTTHIARAYKSQVMRLTDLGLVVVAFGRLVAETPAVWPFPVNTCMVDINSAVSTCLRRCYC